jgi:hypothetical protein
MTKDETAQALAEAHFQLDEAITRIFRVVEEDEDDADAPLKLLEVNSATTEAGIMPVGMNADPARGVPYRSVIIEITPEELERIQRHELALPHGWELAAELTRHDTPVRAGR